jgi:protein-disulfide isomerase
MTERQNSNRIPLLTALGGALLLLVVGGYLLLQRATQSEAPQQDAAAEVASTDAEKALAAAGMNTADRKATEAVVRAYILENPEIITEAVTILQQREVANRLGSAKGKLTTPFPGAEAGNPKGDVTLVEFTDYNCGFCRSSVADVERLVEGDGNIRLVYREVPILSSTSRDAALWALAAAKQGKHAGFHKAMFTGGRPDAQSIRIAATRAGVNIAAAQKFITSPEAVAEVDGNLGLMQQIGVSGTPTFIIGNQILEGALGYEALETAVAKARGRR